MDSFMCREESLKETYEQRSLKDLTEGAVFLKVIVFNGFLCTNFPKSLLEKPICSTVFLEGWGHYGVCRILVPCCCSVTKFCSALYSLMDCSTPDQGSNTHPLHWKCRVLTTGQPGNSCTTVLSIGVIGTGSKEVTEDEDDDRDHRGLPIAERRWVFA